MKLSGKHSTSQDKSKEYNHTIQQSTKNEMIIDATYLCL